MLNMGARLVSVGRGVEPQQNLNKVCNKAMENGVIYSWNGILLNAHQQAIVLLLQHVKTNVKIHVFDKFTF